MGTYENIYNQVIENAAKLPKTLLSSITAPEAIYEPPAYAEAHIRVMIMGSEAPGGGAPLSEASIDITASQRLDWKKSCFHEYAVEVANSTPFWRQFDWISQGLGLPGRAAIAWSNACRVQRVEPIGKSYAPDKGPPLYDDNYGATRLVVGEWQSPLVALEWELLKPDVVIVSAKDGFRWLNKTFPNLERRDATVDGFRMEVWENLPSPTIGVNHPAYGRDAPKEAQNEVLGLIKELIASDVTPI